MSKPNRAQLRFARQMTFEQWRALRGLYNAPCYLSASERGDPEIFALVKHRLAQCGNGVPGGFALPVWFATPAGRAIVRLRHRGKV